MALAFDSSLGLGNNGGTGNLTVAFNNVAGNILYVAVRSTTAGTDNITGVTYNGVSLTKVAGAQNPGDRWCTLWRLQNPATGLHNVIISAGIDYAEGIAVSYSGAVNGGDVNGTNTGTSVASISKTLTTTFDKDWTIAAAFQNVAGAITAGASTTLRQASTTTSFAVFDSNAAITPAGSTTLNVNASGGTPNMVIVMDSFGGVSKQGGFFLAAQ